MNGAARTVTLESPTPRLKQLLTTLTAKDRMEMPRSGRENPENEGKNTRRQEGTMPPKGRAGATQTTNFGGHEDKSDARVVDYQRQNSKHHSWYRLGQFHGKPDQVPAATPPLIGWPPATSRTRRISWNAPAVTAKPLEDALGGGDDMELLVRNSIHYDGVGFVLGTAKPHSSGDRQAWM